ncbi:MAG: Unknown protein [uncultured Thiotrichaceae bacterium]|uniref:Scaffold protein FimL second domain-containing protein n=1 Tax=uncultured Thiotrichaceae bacterium TaxID=298394 RepID=A0A6S6TDG7_9GAMM|nr:MAG: Unknown protein [uncultured Thiotrichaceae bacterium]
MISDKVGLDTRVGWIRGEIEKTIEDIESKLNDFVQEKDLKIIEEVSNEMQTLEKTFKVAGIKGVKILAMEIVNVLEAILENKISDCGVTQAVLLQACSQISDYIEHLEEGYADLPIVILPILNELRATYGNDLLSEELVFLPQDDNIGNAEIGSDEFVDLQGAKRIQVYKHLRMHFQTALLNSYQGKSVQASLKKMQVLSNDLVKIHQAEDVRVLWWLSKALTEALEHQALDYGVAVKLVLGSLERLILKFASDAPLDSHEAAIGLIKKNLLYYIGMAERGSATVDKVKDTFLLDIYLPKGETLEKLRKHYTSPSQQLWRAVAESVNLDIEDIIDGYKHIELNYDEGTLKFILEKSKKTASTLGMLGLSNLADIIEKQILQFNALSRDPQRFPNEQRLEVATEWLRVKDILEEYSETGQDATQYLYDQDSGYQVSTYNARKQVFIIIKDELAAVVENLDGYEKDAQLGAIHASLQKLSDIREVFHFLHQSEVELLLDGAINFLQQIAGASELTEESSDGLKNVAEIIASVEQSVLAQRNHTDHITPLDGGFTGLRALDQNYGLDASIRDALDQAQGQVLELKKLQRQNKLELILAR